MSKILEALKSHDASSAPGHSGEREIRFEKTSRELTQEQLGEIYFSATGKPRTAEPPVIIRVIEKPRMASIVPWIITSLAFLITALSLFSTKRVFVDIKIVDDKNPYTVTALPPQERMQEALDEAGEDALEADANRIPLQEFIFEGAAYLKSSRERRLLTLVNSSVAPFARATIHFERPLNLRKGRIVFYAKGEKGGENLAVALKDEGNIQAFHKGKMYPFPSGLTTGWQRAEISLAGASKDFDSRRVESLRLEFGSKDTSNRPGDTIMIRDLQWFSE